MLGLYNHYTKFELHNHSITIAFFLDISLIKRIIIYIGSLLTNLLTQ